ncbi:hypothetical protein PIROE2DRAFT_59052 [Piromyces sp. E2]|nr:hypothetical protein PIROE2DRAFT_59052 [Piromyces sp. E2]|eukprot:OUM66958.1 hypothetical protein PIROE2DRAFT_59052 [Piromyces sp. E2]
MNELVQENKKLNEYIAEQEDALFAEIQKNAKLEKVNNELYEQINFFKMEVVDLNQKISYITNKINCDDIVKDLIYKQQAEIVSLKEELSMSKNTSSQLRSRLKSQVEELKYIKRQSLQITQDMAKEVESQLADIHHQLYEANKTIEEQQAFIDLTKKTQMEFDDMKSKYANLKEQYKKEINTKSEKSEDEKLKVGVKALISIIGDLEKQNDDALTFFNEADSNVNKNIAIYEISSKLDRIVNVLNQQGLVGNVDNKINSRGVTNSVKDNFNDENDNSNAPFKERIDYMKKLYNDSINTINEMGNELIESKTENENNKEKIKTLSDIIMKLMETIVNLEEDKKSLQKNIDEYLIVINDCGEDIRKLHFNEKDLITAISESGHEICVLKQKIQEMISYQEKYMSMDGEVLMNKVAALTSRNQDLEKELTLLRKFDINNSLKKSLEEGQLQSAWYEISKLRSHVDKLTQNSRQLEKDLANARSEISSIILTRDEAIITQQEALENLEILQRSYVQQMHQLRNEVFRIYSSRPSEVNNRILNLVNEMQILPNYGSMQYETRMRNARYEALEAKIHEAEEIIDSLTRENFEYQKKLNKLNEINEKLVAKIIVQNKNSQDSPILLSQSSFDNSNPYVIPKRSQDRYTSSVHNNNNPAFISPSTTPIPPPHGTSPVPPPHKSSTSLPTPSSSNPSTPTSSNINNDITHAKASSTFIPPPPINTLKKSNTSHILKVKQSIENLNKRGLTKANSQLCLQSDIRSPEPSTQTPLISKFISSVPIKTDGFSIKESKEDYNKLLNYYGSIPHNNRISNIKDEYLDMKDYMAFEIQSQHQIMEAIKNGEIPFYSSDNEDSTEVLVINEDE